MFDRFTIDLQSVTALISHPFNLPNLNHYVASTNNFYLTPVNTTYLEAWRAGAMLPMGLDLSWNGALFFDDTQSRPVGGYRGMTEMVNTAKVKYEKGIFFADAELAGSAYTEPALTITAVMDPLTGTAMVINVGAKGRLGSFKAYYRSVSAGFHAAGAQTRTQDANWEFMGPLLTEITQVNTRGAAANSVGTLGVGLGMPPAPEPVWNMGGIIAPGSVLAAGSSTSYGGAFVHLLPFNFLNDISPYGMATPNRDGFGLDGEFKLMGGVLVAKAGFDSAVNLESVLVTKPSKAWVIDLPGNTAAPVAVAMPFTYQQLRVGLDVNIRTKWPAKVTLGWTSHDTRNGENSWRTDASGNPIPYALTSQLIQAGAELHPNEKLTFAIGYQHTDATGFSDAITVNGLNSIRPLAKPLGVAYDQMAYSVYWYVTDASRVDFLYENLLYAASDVPWARWEMDTALVRFGVDF